MTTNYANLPGSSVEVGGGSRKMKNDERNPSKVLIVTVQHLLYPVNLSMLHQIFSRFGIVQKIVTFTKRGKDEFQAMVQMESLERAGEAKKGLDGENVFDDCNTLRVNYSTYSELSVKYNCPNRSWDYTNPHLPSPPGRPHLTSPPGRPHPTSPPGRPHLTSPPGRPHLTSPNDDSSGGYFGPGPPPALAGYDMHHVPVYPQHFQTGPYMNFPYMNPHNVMGQQPRLQQTGMAPNPMNNMKRVVFVSGVDAETTCNQLFNVLSLYGIVERVKLLHKKQNAALVQFSQPLYAAQACHILSNFSMGGLSLKVVFSNNNEVTIPRGIVPAKNVSYQMQHQRFSSSQIHEQYLKHTCKPTSTLHIANLPSQVDEESVKEIFGGCGTVKGFRILTDKKGSTRNRAGTRMALINMSSPAEATLCVAKLHNFVVEDKPMKVSFTKQTFNSGGIPSSATPARKGSG